MLGQACAARTCVLLGAVGWLDRVRGAEVAAGVGGTNTRLQCIQGYCHEWLLPLTPSHAAPLARPLD